jgi:hypothetical protein
MIGVPLTLFGAARASKRCLRSAAGALVLSGVVAGGLGIFGVHPVGATDVSWFAYAGGTSISTTSCPWTSTVASQCSLTQALSDARAGDNVLLATPGSSAHYDGNFTIGTSMNVRPAAGVVNPVLDGDGGTGPVVTVDVGQTATINAVTITGGTDTTSSGGGIDNAGTLTISDSTVSGNSVNTTFESRGGGIYNSGAISINSSTVSDNVAEETTAGVVASGGGIANEPTGTAIIDNSTISRNSAVSVFEAVGGAVNNLGTATIEDSTITGNQLSAPRTEGGGLTHDASAPMTLAASIIAKNAGLQECSNGNSLADAGYNVADDGSCALSSTGSINNSPAIDSYLGTLSSNGGLTDTIPLLASPTSPDGPDPALKVIPSSFVQPSSALPVCSVPDQRGVARSAPCDMGAFETDPANVATPPEPVGPTTNVAPGATATSPAGSVSNPTGVVVGVTPTTTTVTASNSSPALGGPVTYTAMVSLMPDSGTVTFSDNGSPVTCGAGSISLTSGVAECNVTYTSAGSHTIVATYSGDTSSGPSVSNPVGVGVAVTPTAPSLMASNTTPAVGGTATDTATVSPMPDVSNPVGVGVAVTPTTTTLTASNTSPGVGQTVTYTAMVSPMPDAGTVTFSDNGSPIACGFGSISLTSGVAECNVTYTSVGSHTIVATYSGDTSSGPSVSNPVGVGVAPDDGSVTDLGTISDAVAIDAG